MKLESRFFILENSLIFHYFYILATSKHFIQ